MNYKPHLIVPSLSELKALFVQHPPELDGLDHEKILFIVSFVFNHQISFYDSRILGDDIDGVTISSSYFQKILSRKSKLHFEYLVKHGVLRLVRKHFTGATCRKYLLNEKYMKDPSFYTLTGFTFSRSVSRHLNKQRVKGKYDHLQEWLKKIEFDAEGATVFNNLMFESRKNFLPFQSISKRNRRTRSNPHHQYVNGQMSILRLKAKDDTCKMDSSGMRLHTSITNCPKLLRNYITVGGEPLVSIDIKNSQPFMMLALFNPEHIGKLRRTSYPTTQLPPPNLQVPVSDLSAYNISSIILRHSSVIQSSIEFQEYREMVTNGTIYEQFVDLMKIDAKELELGFSPRDTVKFRFMLCFYSANGSRSGGMKPLFRMKFPKIYSLMCDLKEKHHNTLAILLQRVESILVLDQICSRIALEKPKVPLFTIHDSILTTSAHVDYVKGIIEEECVRYIGVAPRLTIEACTPKENGFLLKKMDDQVKNISLES